MVERVNIDHIADDLSRAYQDGYNAGYADALAEKDVRPVVLCRDCVYSDKWYANRLICHLWNEQDGNAVFEDGFCNYGFKKEES